jgi:hypothetical protein
MEGSVSDSPVGSLRRPDLHGKRIGQRTRNRAMS